MTETKFTWNQTVRIWEAADGPPIISKVYDVVPSKDDGPAYLVSANGVDTFWVEECELTEYYED